MLPKKSEDRSCNRDASWHTWIWECWAFTWTDCGSSCLRKRQRRRDTREEEHCAHELCDVQELRPLWGMKAVLGPLLSPLPQAAAGLRASYLGFRSFVFSEVCGFVLVFFSLESNCDSQKPCEGWKKMHLLDSVLFKAAAQLLGVDGRPGAEWLATLVVNVLIAPILFWCWTLESEGIH